MSEQGSDRRVDAVRWRAWDAAAFAEAAEQQKPILLALVTAWSEECALMDRTSYVDPGVCARIRERFVAIRVDADRRPDVSERYSLGGWPTTVFLTPDGAVLGGGTYLDAARMPSVLDQVADAWWGRRNEIVARRAAAQAGRTAADPPAPGPDVTAVSRIRALMVETFDAYHGGLGTTPRFPHVQPLTLALSLQEEDEALRQILVASLDGVGGLWDPVDGGFFRYARAPDWTRPGTEKLLEDNAALLRLFVDAALHLPSDACRDRAAALVRWVKDALSDEADGGFFNGQAADAAYYGRQSPRDRQEHPPPVTDRTMYVDRNAEMAIAFLRAAELFDDPWLMDFAIRSLERVVLAGYAPGAGVAHVVDRDGTVRGLLGDQIRAASALIWAHAATGRLPYSMLAVELTQYAIGHLWDDEAGGFADRALVHHEHAQGRLRERLRPFTVNCEAACVLARLAHLTGDPAYRDRALVILRSLAGEYPRHGLFGAPYALAIREVVEGHGPLGLQLSRVDWKLDQAE